MKYEKEYSVHEAATILTQFIDLYVDEDKLRKYGLLWNSLNDTVKRVCLNFSQVSALNFFKHMGNRVLFLYDERKRSLCQIRWNEIVHFLNSLEPWEDNIDWLIFETDLSWFIAVTHEDLLTICAGTPFIQEDMP